LTHKVALEFTKRYVAAEQQSASLQFNGDTSSAELLVELTKNIQKWEDINHFVLAFNAGVFCVYTV